MSMLDLKLWRDMWRAKGQVVTIALVVASGVAAFCAALSTYDSLRSMQAAYYDVARFAEVFAAARRVPNSLEARLIDLPGVADAQAGLTHDVMLDLPGVPEPLTARMVALPERGELRMNRLALIRGRWIDQPASNQVLVSDSFARARNLGPGDSVAVLLNGKRELLQIVGTVLSPEYVFAASPGAGDEKSFGVFWIGRPRLAGAFNMEGAFNRVTLRLVPGANAQAAIDRLDRLLAPYGGTGAHGRAEQVSHRALSQEIDEMRVFGLVLPSVFLGVAVFLLNVVLMRQIGTQRSQIAALKALGCPNLAIAGHYLKYVLLIVAIGLVIGVVSGAWLGRMLSDLYARFFHFPTFDYRLSVWIVLAGSGAALTAGTAAALQAIVRIVRLAPADAMRPAAPPVYRATLLERLGFTRLQSPAVRMILRDMERRPARAIFTSVGIAAATAILVSGTWWGDAIEHLLEVELRMRERQDVSVVMGEAVPRSALHALQRLPGVIRAEGDRTAVVRLHHGHLDYRTNVTGLSDDSQLRVLRDPALRPVDLPPEGLVLNERLAARLGLARGDLVRVEFLQGRRLVREVPVVELVGEAMGLQGYMRLDALNRLLGEGELISGARLQLDMSERDAFLQEVKRTPRLAHAMELAPIIRNFRETSARNILVFTMVLTVLAGTIAVGVVYNHARIALAERAWELASLRVLGFTRGEVSALLLGELALEMLVALPLGWWFGHGLSALIVGLIHSETFAIPMIIRPSTYAYASLVVLAAGVFSALIVRRQIDRLDLVGVLKTRE